MNLYEWPTRNPAPNLPITGGVDKSYKIVRVRSYEFVQISHLVKYVSWDSVGISPTLYGVTLF